MDNTRQISVSPAPHIKSADTVSSVMLDVIIALIPAFIASVWFFGLKALVLIVSCVFFSVISEHLCQILMKRKSTIKDYSTIITRLLLTFCLPPTLP
jgi:electron transport complex protein RnfD